MSSLDCNSDTLLAIVGVAGRFPGAADMDSFWRLLCERGDAIRPVPKERWDASAQLDPEKTVQSVGGFLDGVDQFDPTFFGISPREAEDIDPQQRLMLEASWIALEDAGQRPETLAGSRTGVYVGASWHDYEILRKDRGAHATQHTAVGNALDVIAARVSYFYKLTGPSLMVETGCSSAMVAFHLAAQSLAAGEIDGAIVGGANLILAPDVSIGLTRFGGLSPDGRCKAFAATANGFVRGEGVVALYLKTLARAQADGDRIHAVVVATAINNDGGGDSLVTPNPTGQEELLRSVYARVGVPLDEVLYIETHGTGTAVGDPIEAGAIGRAIGQRRDGARAPLAIGSVKTNIGHLEPTAGLAGVAKALLAIRHRLVPPNLHADALNPSIPFDELGLQVVREPLPLPEREPFYIGVNSFGWGGTNAHVILAPPPRDEARERRAADASAKPIVLPISAHHDESLRRRAADVRAAAARDDATLADIAGTLAWRRGHFARRAAFVADSREALCAALDRFAAGEDEIVDGASGTARSKGKVAFVFPGQGSQWVGMGARLFVESPIFAATIRRCAQALAPHVEWNLEEVVAGSASDEWTTRVDMVQPALWAMFVALAEMWREAGIEPEVVVGHSQGEVAAATVAGILSLEDAALIVARRAAIIRRKAGKGLMLAVDLDLEAARAALAGFEDSISIAVNNGPTSCVLSGDAESVMTLKELLDADEVFNRLVRVDYASHSHHMDEFKDELRAALQSIRPRAGRVPLFSTVRLRALAGPEMDADYWVQNLREPVLFADAMARLFEDGVTHVVEVSSHTALVPALEQLAALQADPPRILSTMHRDHGAPADIALSFARAYVAGLEPFATLPRDAQVALAAYPWRRASYWLAAAKRRAASGAGLELELLPAAAEKDLWEGTLEIGLEENPWLRDHKVHDAIVLPGAAMLALALAAGRARTGAMPRTLANVRFTGDLTLGEEPARVGVAFRDDLNEGGTFALLSLASGATSWSEHATARVEQRARPIEARAFPAHLLEQAPRDAEAFYRACAARGLNYGPAFQGVQRVFVADEEALGELRLPQSCRAGARPHGLHPALLDAALQASLALCQGDETVVPTQVRRMTFFVDPDEPVTALWAHAIRRDADHYDLAFFASDESPFAVLEGLTLERLAVGDPASADGERLHRLRFVAQPRSEAQAPAGVWIVCGANADGAQELHDALAIAQARVRRAAPESVSAAEEIAGFVYVAPRAASGLDAQKRGLLALAALVKACSERMTPPRLVVVTADAQAVAAEDRPDPGAALYWGFTRVLRHEQPELQALVLDVAPADAHWAEACAAEVLAGEREDQVALRGDARFVGRLTRGDDERDPALDACDWQGPPQPFRLASARPGFWDGLEYRPLRREPPGPGEIEIAVGAASLNFIDVMKAMGTYPGVEGRAALLGGECAGRVAAVGPGVSCFAPGDRVAACAFGSFASHVTVRADHAQKIPDALADEEAAALPLVMATAWYALVDLAYLAEGESVLIHSATGGLGLAAIEVAKARGARILATAGSEEKRSRLAQLGVADVFDSRDLSWADGVRAATGGRGVDVVLNSLAGAAIPLGLDVLAEDGRFIEVGKKDIYGGRTISLAAFKKGISVSAVDLAGLMERRPERFARLFADVWARVVAGALAPLPVTRFSFADAAEALRAMARGSHIGKFVLTEPESVRDIAPEPMPQGRFRNDATYLVTGGLGALGLSLADYLVDHGAGGIALLGRSRPSAEAERRIAALVARGAQVESFAVDVSDAGALARTLADIRARMPQLRGVVHAAGLLDDAMIVNLRPDQLERVLAPKVDGARNLDALTIGDPLDLFVLFSSAAALVGNAGQAAYASANAYMDALAEARRRHGRPALSVQWGPFAGIGLAAQDDIRGARLAERGMGSFTADEAWDALARLLRGGAPVVGYVPIDLRQWFEAYPATAAQPSWALLREAARSGAQTTAADDFRSQLEAAPQDVRRDLAEGKVRELAGRVLRLDPQAFDRETPFKALGLDSLMGLELRNRLEAAFGLKLSPTLLWTYGNARSLAEVLCGRVFSAAA